MTGKRIYWTSEESDAVIKGIKNLLEVAGKGVPKKVPLKDFLVAANMAQQHFITPERRRLITGFTAVKSLSEKMGITITDLGKSPGPRATKKKVVEAPVEVQQVPEAPKLTLTMAEVEAMVDRKVQEALNRMLHAWVDNAFPVPVQEPQVFVAAPEVKASEDSQVPPAASSELKHSPFPKREEKRKVKTIVVAGVLPAQAQTIAKSISGEANLKFWVNGNSARQLGLMSQAADEVVCMVDKVSHSAVERAQSVVGAMHIHRVSGGVGSLINKVQGLI